MILSGSTLYGMASGGGGSDEGAIFKINSDGSAFSLLHSFTGAADDGSQPRGSLILSGSTLYGMTQQGGANDLGVIFKIETDGSAFSLLHSFTGGANDGNYPWGSLILSGSTLYGMTRDGGDSNLGVIFKINTDGSAFSLLHSFTGGANDGSQPRGSLILSGSTLYGMSWLGGNSDLGVIFKINTDGTGFSLLHSFTGGANDGRNPFGSLILSGSTLYGMTPYGGDQDWGVVLSQPLSAVNPGGQLLLLLSE
ncbi:MAG: hypothetical protein JRI89_09525 [Deltaproteobacteria bacterium]|nr:hypothetical protein [Deltaproteobacteria bacterium]